MATTQTAAGQVHLDKTGVGLIGCGAIGRRIAAAVQAGEAGDAGLVAVFDQDPDMARALSTSVSPGLHYTDDFDYFLSSDGLDLVLECASPAAVGAFAARVLEAGKDLVLMSSGALTDRRLFKRLSDLAISNDSRMLVPSGAIGGIDAVRAVRHQLDEVSLTTTKPPKGLTGAPGFADWESVAIEEPTVVFEGPALEAVRLFPANVNVSATLSLAGLGPELTQVRVVADPSATQNVHEVVAKGSFGSLTFKMELEPDPDNPKTSGLAISSAIETLRAACSVYRQHIWDS